MKATLTIDGQTVVCEGTPEEVLALVRKASPAPKQSTPKDAAGGMVEALRKLQEEADKAYVYRVNPLCDHSYPNPWFGTIPPACLKCGRQGSMSKITWTLGV